MRRGRGRGRVRLDEAQNVKEVGNKIVVLLLRDRFGIGIRGIIVDVNIRVTHCQRECRHSAPQRRHVLDRGGIGGRRRHKTVGGFANGVNRVSHTAGKESRIAHTFKGGIGGAERRVDACVGVVDNAVEHQSKMTFRQVAHMYNRHLSARNQRQQAAAASKAVLQNAEAHENQEAVDGHGGNEVLEVEVKTNGLSEKARCVDVDLNAM